MGIEKLKKILEILWNRRDDRDIVGLKFIRATIMETIGTDPRTMDTTLRNLQELGWLTRLNKHHFRVNWEFLDTND